MSDGGRQHFDIAKPSLVGGRFNHALLRCLCWPWGVHCAGEHNILGGCNEGSETKGGSQKNRRFMNTNLNTNLGGTTQTSIVLSAWGCFVGSFIYFFIFLKLFFYIDIEFCLLLKTKQHLISIFL